MTSDDAPRDLCDRIKEAASDPVIARAAAAKIRSDQKKRDSK